jgi:hypothetical protein
MASPSSPSSSLLSPPRTDAASRSAYAASPNVRPRASTSRSPRLPARMPTCPPCGRRTFRSRSSNRERIRGRRARRTRDGRQAPRGLEGLGRDARGVAAWSHSSDSAVEPGQRRQSIPGRRRRRPRPRHRARCAHCVARPLRVGEPSAVAATSHSSGQSLAPLRRGSASATAGMATAAPTIDRPPRTLHWCTLESSASQHSAAENTQPGPLHRSRPATDNRTSRIRDPARDSDPSRRARLHCRFARRLAGLAHAAIQARSSGQACRAGWNEEERPEEERRQEGRPEGEQPEEEDRHDGAQGCRLGRSPQHRADRGLASRSSIREGEPGQARRADQGGARSPPITGRSRSPSSSATKSSP